ncbi:MAG: NTE family protein [Planctomycetota bacterium]|jgi:NTE family protein
MEDEQEAQTKGTHNFDMSRQVRPRTVLILGGGGMRGMAHVGVLRALRELGIEYDAIVATSIGALVGGLAASGTEDDEIEDIVTTVQKGDYFKLNFLKFMLKGTRTPSMYSGERFRQNLLEIMPEGSAEAGSLTRTSVPMYCNSVCLETGGSVFWGTRGSDDISLVDAVYASCALPGIFEPFERNDKHYMDGGIVDALPLRFAKTLKPELIIAVDLTVKATFKEPNYKNRATSTMLRAFEIAEEVVVEQMLHMHADYKTVLIQPKVGHLQRFDFDDVKSVIKLGEDEARRVLTSHAATRQLVTTDLVPGLFCPIEVRDYVSIRIDTEACIGCGLCEMVCETDAFWARGEKATVRKRSNYECTRDHACARNCPTDAIHLGNL